MIRVVTTILAAVVLVLAAFFSGRYSSRISHRNAQADLEVCRTERNVCLNDLRWAIARGIASDVNLETCRKEKADK